MAAEFTIRVDASQVQRLFAQLPGAVATRVVHKGIATVTKTAEREVKQALSGQVLKVRSNRYRSSVTSTVEERGGQVIGTVGTTFIGAGLHEKGGTVSAPGKGILSKGRQFLTIPLPAARTGAGVPRFDAPTALKAGAFIPKGRSIIANSVGGRLVPLFALKRSVHIPARPIWKPVFDRMSRLIPDLFERLLSQTIREMR